MSTNQIVTAIDHTQAALFNLNHALKRSGAIDQQTFESIDASLYVAMQQLKFHRESEIATDDEYWSKVRKQDSE